MDETAATPETGPAGDGVITWDYRIPLLTNGFMLWDLLRVTALSIGLMWLAVFVMSLATADDPVLLPPPLIGIMSAAFLGLLLLACLLLGNHVGAWFGVGPAGVVWTGGRRERTLNRAAALVGLLTLEPGVAGAGLLAEANESGALPWRDVHRVIEHPEQHVITVRNSWRTVVRLYCPPERWEAIRAIVAEGADQGAAERVTDPAPKRPWLPIAAWIVGPLVLIVASLVWEFRPDETGLWAVLAGVFVCLAGETTGAARRIFGGFAVAPAVFAILLTSAEAMTTFESLFGGEQPLWTLDTPTLAVSLGAQGLLLLLALGMVVLPQRATAG